MAGSTRVFPWRFFLRFFGAQALILFLVEFRSGVSAKRLIILIASFLILSSLAARAYFRSLERLLKKARNEDEAPSEEELHGTREVEWEELEIALDQMRSELRKKTEALAKERQELEVLMAAIPEAIVAIDTENRLLFFNSRFALLFGEKGDSTRPVLGEIFRAPELLETFRQAIAEGSTLSLNLPLHTRTEQASRYFSVAVTPLRKETGPVYAAVGIFHDVTELKQAEKIRIDFVANVSHELRTPLTAIKGYADTLSEDIRHHHYSDLEKYLAVIQRNTERLMTLIEDLLDLSSLESAESAELTKTQVSTQEVTTRILAQIEARSARKNQTIEVTHSAPIVHSDPGRLEQVLTNLIDNAIKYCPAGGRIQILWEQKPGAVVLRIRDNGPGIPRELQPRLFERFFRVDKARSREMGGTGLGLAIVKHIMQKHGGSVQVTSDLGQGTEFACEFPTS